MGGGYICVIPSSAKQSYRSRIWQSRRMESLSKLLAAMRTHDPARSDFCQRLPREVCDIIFRLLDNAALYAASLVCKRWRSACIFLMRKMKLLRISRKGARRETISRSRKIIRAADTWNISKGNCTRTLRRGGKSRAAEITPAMIGRLPRW